MPKIPSAKKTPNKTESPESHFKKPQEIAVDDALTRGEKKKALDTWEVDAQALERAQDEGMTGGKPSKLTDVLATTKILVKRPDVEKKR